MAHGPSVVDGVLVAPADAGGGQVSGFGQVANDLLDGALGNTGMGGDVAQPDAGIAGDVHQHDCVVGQERPLCHGGQSKGLDDSEEEVETAGAVHRTGTLGFQAPHLR